MNKMLLILLTIVNYCYCVRKRKVNERERRGGGQISSIVNRVGNTKEPVLTTPRSTLHPIVKLSSGTSVRLPSRQEPQKQAA